MKIVLFANTDWYLFNFRRSLALALKDQGYELLLISPDGPYGNRLRSMGLRWEPLVMERRSLNPLREANLLRHLVRLFRRERPDLVHNFTIKCAVYGSMAARLAGVPSRVNAIAGMGYVFVSDDVKARLLRPAVRTLMKYTLGGPNSRVVLQNSDDVALFRDARLAPPDTVRLIMGSGVDCTRFTPGTLRESDGPLRVLFAARLVWDKGLREFVEAARTIRSQGRQIEFLVAGEPDPGNPATALEGDVWSWSADGLIQRLGHVDDMAALLRSIDVVALPSYREGLPKSLIEGGACGCALVTTDVPGCREVVTHGVDGLLVPVRNATALADAIARLDDDRALLTRLGTAARARVLAEFDERIVIDRTLSVYHELLAE